MTQKVLRVLAILGGKRVFLVLLAGMSVGMLAERAVRAQIECGGGITGTSGNDLLIGTNASDQILGLGGSDEIHGLESFDCMEGGYGASDYDTIYAGGGDDYVLTGNAAIYGLDGADLLQTSPAYYSYVEGTGKADHIYGDPYNNCGTVEAYGNGNDDSVVGGCGNDYLDGGVGTDTVDGSSGTDTCTTGETYYNCP